MYLRQLKDAYEMPESKLEEVDNYLH